MTTGRRIARRTALGLMVGAALAGAARAAPTRPLFVGFYVSWDPASRMSLAANVERLDVVAPHWVSLEGSDGRFTVAEDPPALAIVASARRPPRLAPCLYNAHAGRFDGPQADRLLADPAARAALIAGLAAQAERAGYAGYVLDLEEMSPAGLAAYPGFVADLRAALGGRTVWVATPFGDRGWPLVALQAAADALVLMAYDQHWMTGDPGPVSGQDWFQAVLARRLAELDPQRILIGLADYGYDWTLADAKGPLVGAPVTCEQALALARNVGARVRVDPVSKNPGFDYIDDEGRAHRVWFLDAAATRAHIAAAAPHRPHGYALWRMGGEDPALWRDFDRRAF